MQIQSLHSPRAVEIVYNRHAVAEIVGGHERGAIGSHRQTRGIQRRFSLVVIFRRHFSWIADGEKWRRHFGVWPRRGGLDRCGSFRIEAEDPYSVFESAGNVHGKTSIGRSSRCEGQADICALRRWKIDVLNDRGRGTCIEVDHCNRLLSVICLFFELHAISAVDDQEIAALSAGPDLVCTAQHSHGHCADGGKLCCGILHQGACWGDDPTFSGGLLLAVSDSGKAEYRQQESHCNSQVHEFIVP